MGKKFTTTEGLTTTLYSPEAFGSLSPSEASEQILTTFKTAKHKYPPAKYQYPPDIEKSVTVIVHKKGPLFCV